MNHSSCGLTGYDSLLSLGPLGIILKMKSEWVQDAVIAFDFCQFLSR